MSDEKSDGELLDMLLGLDRHGLLFPRHREDGFDRIIWPHAYDRTITCGEFTAIHFIARSHLFHAGAMRIVSERGGRVWMFDYSGSHFDEMKQRFFFDPDQEKDQRLYVCGFIPLCGDGN